MNWLRRWLRTSVEARSLGVDRKTYEAYRALEGPRNLRELEELLEDVEAAEKRTTKEGNKP